MPDVPHWHLVGDWFDVCKCTIPCPCTFAQAPSEGECEGILAWHIREGHYGDVALDGLNIVGLGTFEGNLWAGEAKATMGLYMDERADDSQREALQMTTARAEALTGPTTLPGRRVQVHNPPGAEVGPGQVATWGTATMNHVDGFGFKWEWDGRSSKHFPFDWEGP